MAGSRWSFRVLGPLIQPSCCEQSHGYTAARVEDASEQAFCSVAYFRFIYANSAARCAFVNSRCTFLYNRSKKVNISPFFLPHVV